ncbi:aminodeoxychorismate synthase component I [Muriicola soli]|uniref:Aminodeoxychorismate synthase component I n=1 Tax=Muriicola soli TaxID=2507538 RepID=A0A411EBZ3_9FLAO|nr:aminodeoxychorismate synthase component I [Muriicola soli]QBA65027.1 aminodeoxychorismate synthase component I [Muriicola soli]
MESIWGNMNDWGKEGIPFLFIVDFEQKHPLAWTLDTLPPDVLYDFKGRSNANRAGFSSSKTFSFEKNPISIEDYEQKFSAVQKELRMGNSYLLNLTIPTPVQTNIDLETVFYKSRSKYAIYLKDEFVSFSPETFIKIDNGFIYTYPMKGTISTEIPNAEELILADAKEAAEHATIVDLMRNDLSKVARRVEVIKYRYYEVLKSEGKEIGQVSSEIRGQLLPEFSASIGDLLKEMLPAGSVSGAPKPKTCQLIHEIEGFPRGYYTGVAGIFDGKALDSCVLIRYIDQKGMFKSGGGITAQSSLESEYQEMIDKVYVPVY